jgi:hypothetical protein
LQVKAKTSPRWECSSTVRRIIEASGNFIWCVDLSYAKDPCLAHSTIYQFNHPLSL